MTAVWVTPDALHKIPIFRYLNDEALKQILRSASNRVIECRAGDMVFKEGEIGDCMYLILEGAAEIFIRTVGGRQISMQTLKAGAYFGEQSLMPGSTGRRNASVRCLGPTKLFRISKPDVLLGLTRNPNFTSSRPKAIASSNYPEVLGLLRGVRLFRGLTEIEIDTIPQWTEVIECEPGQFIFKEGQVGDFLYVLLEGRVEIFIVNDFGKVITLEVLARGEYFGEQALLPDGPGLRNANARTDEDAKLIKIPKSAFVSILKRDPKLSKALCAVGESQAKEIARLRNSRSMSG
ncbi:MAG: cyclic nucleotide-binding domain-containing protein [Gammaproteobacteria bacterium]|nr:cyclic nucleotide-binding domain-containing protein [Gammaproteobacteria bacterium]MCI0591725.1 cyclic nucleotide-binding domain-containing protein [Gammaproteobacteria bacterium]